MEDEIRQPDISKSVQRVQPAIDEAKVRLNLAVSPGAWLKPSNLVINTQSAVGYNNGLRKSGARMKLEVNDSVHADKSDGWRSIRDRRTNFASFKSKSPPSE